MQDASVVVDLSHPLSPSTPPFPGDPPVVIECLDSIAGAPDDGQIHCNSTRLQTCVHCGTHMDAPYHFFADGVTIDRLPIERFVGAAVLIADPRWTADAEILVEHLVPSEELITQTKRVVLRSGWDKHWRKEEYFDRHPVLPRETAQWIVDRGVVLVGVDFPSVDHAPYPAHQVLLGSGLVIVENLTNLEAIESEVFELITTPLALVGRDGSPVRALGRFTRGV